MENMTGDVGVHLDSTLFLDSQPIEILHIEDDPSFADLVATFLEREKDAFTVRTETDPRDALAILEADTCSVDCIVSDYDMPGLDGLAVLERVRETHPEIPFILFTGKGSEEIASEAITAGVTDYLQKAGGTEQYSVLANRIQNAVGGYRAERYMNRGLEAIETAKTGSAFSTKTATSSTRTPPVQRYSATPVRSSSVSTGRRSITTTISMPSTTYSSQKHATAAGTGPRRSSGRTAPNSTSNTRSRTPRTAHSSVHSAHKAQLPPTSRICPQKNKRWTKRPSESS
jgi:DNA-binding NarL/FixJ family response regulator